MFDPKSDYALNKMDPEAIIYIDSGGTLIRLSVENFASPEEFQRWKEWSDTDYHELEKGNHVFSNHTVSATGDGVVVQSAEDILIGIQDQQERQELVRLLMLGLDSCLTVTQRRRLWMYCVDGLTVRQIAKEESVSHSSVVECLMAAKRRLQKFLKNNG